MLTHREAYVYGWVYGSIEKAIREKNDKIVNIPGRAFASERPLTAMAQVISTAMIERAMTKELDRQIAEALSEITWVEEERPEPVLPLEIQGSWQLGYFHARSGNPLLPPLDEYRLAEKRRAKGYSQAQLAEEIGVAQTLVSRWELGKTKIPADKLAKIKEILG